MRTKALLLTGALLAATAVTSVQAQSVFSVNAVGYVNVEIPAGFSIIANPLDAADNSVPALFAGVPLGTTIYKFDNASGNYITNALSFAGWADPSMTLEPGEGAFVLNAGAAAMTVTFVGEVRQGSLTTSLPAGFSMASSQVPQAGALSTDLGFPGALGDLVYFFRNGGYETYSQSFAGWSPSEPSAGVAEGFFVDKAAATDWTRDFSVND
jgi:hypothetical protein